MESSKDNPASPANSSAEKDAGKIVYKQRYTEREIALRKLAFRLGMTRDDVYHYLGIK
jgi:hypothetical protein